MSKYFLEIGQLSIVLKAVEYNLKYKQLKLSIWLMELLLWIADSKLLQKRDTFIYSPDMGMFNYGSFTRIDLYFLSLNTTFQTHS